MKQSSYSQVCTFGRELFEKGENLGSGMGNPSFTQNTSQASGCRQPDKEKIMFQLCAIQLYLSKFWIQETVAFFLKPAQVLVL